jgi:peroxiredoxin
MPKKDISATPLPNGSHLPELPNFFGLQHQSLNIRDVKRENGIVIAFVHGTWCPYCIHQITRLNQVEPELSKRGVGLVCISHDRETTITAYQHSAQPPLRYPLLADAKPSVSKLFGVFDSHPDHESPFPSLFYVDAGDVIRYSDVSSDPDCYPSSDEMMKAIDGQIAK